MESSDLVKEYPILHTIHFWTFSVLIKLIPCVVLTFFMCWMVNVRKLFEVIGFFLVFYIPLDCISSRSQHYYSQVVKSLGKVARPWPVEQRD